MQTFASAVAAQPHALAMQHALRTANCDLLAAAHSAGLGIVLAALDAPCDGCCGWADALQGLTGGP